MKALRGAIEHPGEAGAIFAPSLRLFTRVVLPTWQAIVPAELYRWRPGDACIEMVNGSSIYCLGVDRNPQERIVGMNLAWAVFDEAGASKDPRIVRLIGQRLRRGDPARRFLALYTSPHGHGWLSDWAHERREDGGPAVSIVRATTYENTHLSPEYIRELEQDYPPGTTIHRQEMLGEFVSATGLVYGDVFCRADHAHEAEYTYTAPYELGVDPGYRASGWVAMQQQPSGRWVAVREWTPGGEFTEITAARIVEEMGKPPRQVYCDTPSKQNSRLGIPDHQVMQQVFGGRCQITVAGGARRSSDWRHKAVIGALSRGDLGVSTAICPLRVSHDERGLVYSLETLEWPDESTRSERQDVTDPRKHIVDALEFWAAYRLPPRAGSSEDRARRLHLVS